MTLHDRCRQYLINEPVRLGEATENLVAFVTSEIGRAADSRLEDSLPLCLYFSTEADRREFIDAVQMAKPGMIAKRWPE